jgi:GT2 family glycosyltransferase
MSNSYRKVYVIIVTYNGTPWIEACLRSLEKSTYPNHVVVVDNASTDLTVEVIERFSNVTLLKQTVNLGFGKANNIGIEWALKHNADFVFLLNQDTTVDPDCIERMVMAAAADDYGVISPVHWDSTGKKFDRGFERYVRGSISADELYSLASRAESTIVNVDFVNAAAWLVSAKVIQLIGGFAPLFFHYGEDRDYAQRLAYFRLRIGVVTIAGIRHFRDDRVATVAQWKEEKKRRYYFVGGLCRISNVNTQLGLAWWSAFVWLIKESVSLVLKGDLRAVPRTTSVIVELLKFSSRIREHRKQVQSKTPYQFLACASE